MKVVQSENRLLLIHNPKIEIIVTGTCDEILTVDHVNGINSMLLIAIEEL